MNNDLKKINHLKQTKNRNIQIPVYQFEERVIQIKRVSKVTKGGLRLSFTAAFIVGNKKGTIGLGIGKASEIPDAIKKAKRNGMKNLISIPITKSLSIPHDILGHYGACHVLMRPAIEGSGVIAGGAVRIILEILGVQNIIAKQLGSNNLLNNARATINALTNLMTNLDVAKKRNIKLENLF
jgi:small subunit ribosomal protein S5